MTRLEIAIKIWLSVLGGRDRKDSIMDITYKKKLTNDGKMYYYTIIYRIDTDEFALELHSYYDDKIKLNINSIDDIISLSKMIDGFCPNYNLTI